MRSLVGGISSRTVSIVTLALSFAVMARALTAPQFGVVATMSTFVVVLGVADLGLGAALVTRLAVSITRHAREGLSGTLSATAVSVSAIAVLLAGLCGLLSLGGGTAAFLGASSLPEGQVDAAVLTFGIGVGLSVVGGVGTRIYFGVQRGHEATLWEALGSIVGLGFVAGAAAWHAPMWTYVAGCVAVPASINVLATIRILFDDDALPRPRLRDVERRALLDALRSGAPYFAINLSIAVALNSDTFIVARTLNAREAAVFAVSARLFGTVRTTLARSSLQLWSAIAEALASGDKLWVASRFRWLLAGYTAVATLVSVGLVAFAPWITIIWVGADLVAPTNLLFMQAVWTVYSVSLAQVGYLLNGAQMIRQQAMMFPIMAVVNVILSVALTRSIGLSGPVIGSVVAHGLIVGVPSIYLAARFLRHPIPTTSGQGSIR